MARGVNLHGAMRAIHWAHWLNGAPDACRAGDPSGNVSQRALQFALGSGLSGLHFGAAARTCSVPQA